MVREYKGRIPVSMATVSRVRCREDMFGSKSRAVRGSKNAIRSKGLFNPNKIVDPPRHDDRTLFRFNPAYEENITVHGSFETGFNWSEWGGFHGAVEMCNNNGACRKIDPGVMCPSYRITKNEKDLVRGRANTLRLALSGQLGSDALTAMKCSRL